jgi:hypothetical protein
VARVIIGSVHVRAREAQGSIFEDVTVAKDARHVFISTHNGITQANKVIPRNGARCVLGHMSGTSQHLVQVSKARTSHNAGDDSSSASSVTSLADSLFSTTSGSSRSSVVGPAGAGERLALLLLSDCHLSILYQEAFKRVIADKFERKFRKIPHYFAFELRKDTDTPQQRSTAYFVRYQARNSAYI